MEPVFDSSTEYKSSYTWKNRPQEEEADKYEEAVERMMQAQFISFSPNSNKSKQEIDPYEMIVRRKMNENTPEEDIYQQNRPKSDSGSMKSSGSSHSHHHHHQQNQPPQYQDHQNNFDSGAGSVSSRSSSRSSKSRHSDIGSFQDINDNLSVGSSQDTEIKVANKTQKSKKKKKEYDVSHLNKSKRNMKTEEYTGDLRPVFFRNPEHATEEEKKYLYGPFYVSWPKNKPMPPQYAELQKVYHNTHYY